MTRVIHTGDTHIGYQQYNAPERRRDFLEAFRRVAEDAVEADVDAVIHAGDLFHDRRPGLVDLQGTVEVLRTLADAEIPFLAIVGNHEGKRDAQWLDLFSDLGLATRLGPSPLLIGETAFYGLDFVPRSRREDLEYDFEAPPEGADHAALVAHGLFEPFAHADWDTETMLEESTIDFDAVLLGDNHKPEIAEVLDTWVSYCGSTERASASEREERGYNLVTFDEEVAISRRGLSGTREFVFVDVELEEGEGTDRVQERVREYDPEDAVVIVTVEGEGRPITPATVEEFAIDRGALVARVNDRRELAEPDEEVAVSFADPDEAVRERIRELGLSNAALDIDRTVRDGDVVDANLRETVERRVRKLLEADAGAFDSAPDRHPEEATTVADVLPADDEPSDDDPTDEGDAADAAEADDPSAPESAAALDEGSEADAGADSAPNEDEGSKADDEAATADADEDATAADADGGGEADEADDTDAESPTDGQVSMGDFV